MEKILESIKLKNVFSEIGENLEKGNPYNSDFEYFDFHESRFEYLTKILKKYFKAGDNFLDIGSLFGYMCLSAKLIGYKSYGLDLSKYVEEFKIRFNHFEIDNLACDLGKETAPFESASFDLILASEVLEHFDFHPNRFFKEMERLLRPGGRLIITTPNLVRVNNVVKIILGRSINWDIKDEFWDGVHRREFTAAEIKYLATNNGLNLKKVIYYNFDYPNLSRIIKLANRLVGFIWPKRRGNLVVILKKPQIS